MTDASIPASEAGGAAPGMSTNIGSSWPGRVIIIAATAVLAAAVLRAAPLQSANDRSRWCTVYSLVHLHTFAIDRIDAIPRWSTIDKVRHREADDQPYRFYSSKPPLLSVLVAGLYWLLHRITGLHLYYQTADATRILLLLINVLPLLAALLSLNRSLRRLRLSPVSQSFLTASAAFGSMLNPFITSLNNHTPAAISLIFALSAVVRIGTRNEASGLRSRDFVSLGFWSALCSCFELPAAGWGVAAFVFSVMSCRRRTLRWFIPAAVVPLAAFFVTNWICTGGIKPFYAYYGTDKYEYIHNGVPSYWLQPRGMDANRESPLVYLFHCTFGHHGIFSLTPVLLPAVAGWLSLLLRGKSSERTRNRGLQFILISGGVLSVMTLGFYLTRTQNYNYGGNTSALRWMLWTVPFFWYALVPVSDRLLSGRCGRWLAGVLLAVSVFSAAWSLSSPWRPAWLFHVMESQGWIDYRTPYPPFERPHTAVIGSLPAEVGSRSEWRRSAPSGTEILELTAVEVSDDTVRIRARISDASAAGSTEVTDLVVSRNGMASGNDIADWLRADGEDVGAFSSLPRADQSIVGLLRGLPAPRPYQSGGPAWVQFEPTDPMRVRIERGASRVRVTHPEWGECWVRCDVQYCDRVPFGVLAWDIRWTAAGSGETLSVEKWSWSGGTPVDTTPRELLDAPPESVPNSAPSGSAEAASDGA